MEEEIIQRTTEELDAAGLTTIIETDEQYAERVRPELKEKQILESLRKSGLLKQIEHNPAYRLSVKEKVLSKIDKKEWTLASEILVRETKKYFRFYTTRDDNKTEMWIYSEGIYVPQGKSFVREFIRIIMGDNYRDRLVNETISKIEADTFIEAKEFFNANYIDEIPLENGILNIKTRELKPFTSDKIFFNKIPVKYDLKADCPYIKQHFISVLRDESDMQVLFEIIGYCLLKEYKIEKAIMMLGNGRNGKGKTQELIKRFLGPQNCSSIPLSAMQHNNFCISELFGKMANLAGDISHTDLKETGLFKSLCGRDLIQAGRKFLTDIYFVNHAKLIFACNTLPRVYDTSDGFWDRWVLIEFPYKFVPESEYNRLNEKEKEKHRIMNPDIIKYLTSEEELSGLLNKALDALDRLIIQGNFSYSKGTQEVKDMWVRQSDSFMAFCMDNIVSDLEGIITKKDMRRYYHAYCKKHKVRGASDKAIKAALEELYGAFENQKTMEGGIERVWEGIRFKWNLPTSQG